MKKELLEYFEHHEDLYQILMVDDDGNELGKRLFLLNEKELLNGEEVLSISMFLGNNIRSLKIGTINKREFLLTNFLDSLHQVREDDKTFSDANAIFCNTMKEVKINLIEIVKNAKINPPKYEKKLPLDPNLAFLQAIQAQLEILGQQQESDQKTALPNDCEVAYQ